MIRYISRQDTLIPSRYQGIVYVGECFIFFRKESVVPARQAMKAFY